MKTALSIETIKKLRALSKKKCLYAFDFDGTLARITNTPSAARMNQTTFHLLTELANHAPIAIISGRSASDLTRVLDSYKPQHIIGNHGMEGIAGKEELARAKKINQNYIRSFSKYPFDKDIEIEDKIYSSTIHYRVSKNKKLAKKQVESALRRLSPPPRVIGGKWMMNLTPPDTTHKGTAVLELMKKTKSKNAFFIGDDVTDEDVFHLRDKNILTVRVGRKKTSAAQYYIERQSGINRLLKYLVSAYDKTSSNFPTENSRS